MPPPDHRPIIPVTNHASPLPGPAMLPTDTLLLIAGFVAGGLAALLAWRRHRALGAALTWGLCVASIFWVARYAWLSNQADEMAGIPHALVAGLLFWFVTVPTVAVLLGSWLRARRKRNGG